MNAFQKLRIATARQKLQTQLAADDGSRALCLSIETRSGLIFTTNLKYQGPMTAAILQSAQTAIEELDFKITVASHSLRSLAVEQGVSQPQPISLAPSSGSGTN